jgi:hypothetical protein
MAEFSWKKAFAESIRENIRDHFPRHLIQPGYYLIRLGRERPLVAARIFERPPDDGDTPAGEILGEPCDPVFVWTGRDREPLVAPEGYTIENWYRYQCDLADWTKVNAPEEPLARPYRRVDLTSLPPIPPPGRKI